MSFRTGLVSISFRPLSPREVIDLVVQGGLQEIEWGGDVHVPHGDLARAREVRQMMADAGLKTAAYGSYYRLGKEPGAEGPEFAAVLGTAASLGAPTIRVWPGTRGSSEADASYRARVAEEAQEVAQMAYSMGITVSLEFHANTLTDSIESAAALLLAAPHPNLFTLWQTTNGESLEYCEKALKAVLPRVSNIHAFHWWPTGRDRHPLAAGAENWARYLQILREAGKDKGAILLEFVKGDEPEQFLRDAATLREWVGA